MPAQHITSNTSHSETSRPTHHTQTQSQYITPNTSHHTSHPTNTSHPIHHSQHITPNTSHPTYHTQYIAPNKHHTQHITPSILGLWQLIACAYLLMWSSQVNAVWPLLDKLSQVSRADKYLLCTRVAGGLAINSPFTDFQDSTEEITLGAQWHLKFINIGGNLAQNLVPSLIQSTIHYSPCYAGT